MRAGSPALNAYLEAVGGNATVIVRFADGHEAQLDISQLTAYSGCTGESGLGVDPVRVGVVQGAVGGPSGEITDVERGPNYSVTGRQTPS